MSAINTWSDPSIKVRYHFLYESYFMCVYLSAWDIRIICANYSLRFGYFCVSHRHFEK